MMWMRRQSWKLSSTTSCRHFLHRAYAHGALPAVRRTRRIMVRVSKPQQTREIPANTQSFLGKSWKTGMICRFMMSMLKCFVLVHNQARERTPTTLLRVEIVGAKDLKSGSHFLSTIAPVCVIRMGMIVERTMPPHEGPNDRKAIA